MKQFIVDRHTTPNTPTLEQVPTEKVPIYDTIADAESDLSNLEVGQIVKTKDAGLVANLNPIDEVKQGVFLPPTSNAVAKSLSYSTTEQKTGGKWIDGKPIYRKVFSGTVPSTTMTSVLDTTSMNVDTVITIYGVAFYNNTQQLSIPNKFMSFEKNSPTSNCIGMASDAWNGNPFTCVIEYTKTTD